MNPTETEPRVDSAWPRVRALLRVPTLSPSGFLAWAAVILAAWGVLEALRWREYACVLSGTSPTGEAADGAALFRGMVFVLVYFTGVVVAPVLAIAAGIMAGAQSLQRRSASGAAAKETGETETTSGT